MYLITVVGYEKSPSRVLILSG